jgi:hypothetical protein
LVDDEAVDVDLEVFLKLKKLLMLLKEVTLTAGRNFVEGFEGVLNAFRRRLFLKVDFDSKFLNDLL